MSWRKIILRILIVVFSLYAGLCLVLYFNQESLLFHPKAIAADKQLSFRIDAEERIIKTADGERLNGVLFRSPEPNGKLIFFLHGNAGNIESQEGVAEFYTRLGYDFFTFDYRGFGKSTGNISSEDQFYGDARNAYASLKKDYAEQDIVLIGYSIGSAAAAMLAAENHPSQLVLMAPYYSMVDLAADKYPFVPGFLVSYKFETFRFLPRVSAPICLFHGRNDGTIPYNSSKRLAGLLKKGDRFIPLNDQGHNGIELNATFTSEIERLLQ